MGRIGFLFLFVLPQICLGQSDLLQWQNPVAHDYFVNQNELGTGIYSGSEGVFGLTQKNARFGTGKSIAGNNGFAYQVLLGYGHSEKGNGYISRKLRVGGSFSYEHQWSKVKLSAWLSSFHRGHDEELRTGVSELGFRLTYSPKSWLDLQTGLDRNHIGYGIRSVFLSRSAPVLPFASANIKLGNRIRIYNQYAVLNHHSKWNNPFKKAELIQGAVESSYYRDYFASHVVEWNVVPKFQLLLFDAVVWAGNDKYGHRGFDPNYLNPFGFYRSVEFSSGSSDNALLGIAGRWLAHSKLKLYGSFLLDEFLLSEIKSQNGWWGNKFAVQGGVEVKAKENVVLGGEINVVRPFTYSHFDRRQSYTHTGNPLALRWGGRGAEGLIYAHHYGEKSYTRFQMSVLKKDNGLGSSPLYSLPAGASPYGYGLFNSTAGTETQITFSLQHQMLVKENGKSLGLKVDFQRMDEFAYRINVGITYSSGLGRYF